MAVNKIACFKVKTDADVDGMIEQYRLIEKNNKKDGKSYILSVNPQKTIPDDRNQGFNLVATTSFASVEDMNYYDNSCEAHNVLKAFAKDKVAGPPQIFVVQG